MKIESMLAVCLLDRPVARGVGFCCVGSASLDLFVAYDQAAFLLVIR